MSVSTSHRSTISDPQSLQVWGNLPSKALHSPLSHHILLGLDFQKRKEKVLFSRNFCFLLCLYNLETRKYKKPGNILGISWEWRTHTNKYFPKLFCCIPNRYSIMVSGMHVPIIDEMASPKLLSLPQEFSRGFLLRTYYVPVLYMYLLRVPIFQMREVSHLSNVL